MDQPKSELEHYGKKGMKWGRRSASSSSSTGSVSSLHTESADHIEVKSLRKKKPSELSNKEMQALVTRMNLEQQHAKLNPTTQMRGQKIAIELISKIGNQAVNAVAQKAITLAVGAAFDAVTKPKG